MSGESILAANDEGGDDDPLQMELDRAVCAVRSALSRLAQERRLHANLTALIPLMDRCEFTIIDEDGDSAFEFDDPNNAIKFRSSVLRAIVEGVGQIIAELGYNDDEEARHLAQIAINLFITHEILHIIQNFSEFSVVQDVKSGLPMFGLPSIDAAADVIACSICAVIDSDLRGDEGEKGYLRSFSICLIIAYAIGSRLFDAKTKPEKRQRALGLLISALLVQALVNDRLIADNISKSWKPTSPILLFNANESGVFNAIVLDEVPALLFRDGRSCDAASLKKLWCSVGSYPIQDTLNLVARLLVNVGATK